MKKGFTLIELLVVLAVISLLATVVMAVMSDAKNRSDNSSVKDNLNNIRSQMNISYSSFNSYSGLCVSDTNLVSILQNASQDGAGNTVSYVCNDSSGSWAASAPLRVAEGTSLYWCVDSTNASIGELANLSAGVTQCP